MADKVMQAEPDVRGERAALYAHLDARALAGTLELDMLRDVAPMRLEDLSFISMLPATQRQQVLRRLYALVRNEDNLTVAQASKLAGVTAPNFYRLRRLWADRQATGLQFLAGYAARKPQTLPRAPEVRDWIYKRVKSRDLQHIADFPLKEVSGLLQERLSRRVSAHVLDIAARRLRQDVRDVPETFRRMYGSKILVDYSAISVVAVNEGDIARPVEVAWVIEEASQLILAALPSFQKSPCGTQRDALEEAARSIRGRGFDVRKDEPAQVQVIAPDPSSPEDERYAERLASILPKGSVMTTGPRRFGRFVLDVVGPYLGRIKIIPRATPSKNPSAAQVRAFGKAPLERIAASLLLAEAVDAHNRPIIESLRSSDLAFANPDDGPGGMESALAAIVGPLS